MTISTVQPFALADSQKGLDSDNTTWQFLSCSAEYKQAFDRVRRMPNNQDALAAILDRIVDSSSVGIASAQDNTCWQKFGIAAWLDPTHSQLPALKSSGDSWFFPLKRPVQEDPRRLEVSGEPPLLSGRPTSCDMPRLIAEELAFGYGGLRPLPTRQGRIRYQERMLCVAIDCSVPPDGQLVALKILAQRHRDYWQQDGLAVNRGKGRSWYIDEIESDEVFAHVEFRRTHDRGIVEANTAHVWRVVGIDTLGPIAEQIELCRGELRRTYLHHLDDRAVKPWLKKFPRPMPMETGNSEPTPGSNCYLQALLVIAKLIPQYAHDKANMQNSIAKELHVYGARRGWQQHFLAELDTHITFAQMYRWLVHDQVSFESFAEPEWRNAIAA